jgi:hypothetical protein
LSSAATNLSIIGRISLSPGGCYYARMHTIFSNQ